MSRIMGSTKVRLLAVFFLISVALVAFSTLAQPSGADDESQTVPAGNYEPLGRNIPVGTIISSALSPMQLSGLYDNFSKKWALCDGKKFPHNNAYSKITGSSNSPDLRGYFLRGMSCYEPGVCGSQDPEGGTRGVLSSQTESFGSHTHTFKVGHTAAGFGHLRDQGQFAMADNAGGGSNRTDAGIIVSSGGNETRPDNATVYYYIRIND